MQIKKAGAVAVGALATVAAMGAPAAAATQHVDAGKLSAMKAAGSQFFGTARGGWSAPWDLEPQSLLAAGTGSVLNGAAWQICGSDAVAGIGVTVTSLSPDTVMGGCTNANIWLKQDTVPPVLGALDDTAIAVASWQACGSIVGGGIAATVSVQSPHTVMGDCDNSNIVIGGEENGYEESTTVEAANAVALRKGHMAGTRALARHSAPAAARGMAKAPWGGEPQSLLTVGNGSAIQAASWQLCGGGAVWGVGGVGSFSSPNTVWGDCRNATVKIDQDDPTSVISVLDNSSVNLAPWQVCGSSTVAGVGLDIAVMSPNTVFGSCHNADTIIS